jgi:hypothetical protein
MRLADELSRGECRTDGAWLHYYWVNNAIHRLASSFERLSKAVGYDRSVGSNIKDRRAKAAQWFGSERDKHLFDNSHMGLVWMAANKQKHELTAPEDERVIIIDELVVLGALHTVIELVFQNAAAIARSYESLVRRTARG